MVSATQMLDKLYTVEQVQNKLAATEPLAATLVSNEDSVQFKFESNWNFELDSVSGVDVIPAEISVNGNAYPLTKDAVLTAAASFGLQGTYARTLPAPLMRASMDYHFGSGMGDKAFNMLTLGEDNVAAAFVKPTSVPFSNLQLLETAIESIKETTDSPVYADYKFNHSINRTDIRLILPDWTRTIVDTGLEDDVWSAGIHLSNSLTAKTQTAVEAYLFRWWCTNGATSQMPGVGVWNRRRLGHNPEDVMDWARESVDEVLGGLEHKFEEVQALTALTLTGDPGAILQEVFSTYGVPVSQRAQIAEAVITSENMTMYDLMQATTRLANNPDLRPERADTLMRIGGSLPTGLFASMNAKIWNEGHSAGPQSRNPYDLSAH